MTLSTGGDFSSDVAIGGPVPHGDVEAVCHG
jgi:hypothetical protein